MLQGKLYDYWQPVETFGNPEDDEEAVFIEDDEETIINENDTLIAENKGENEKTEVKEDMEVVAHPGDKEDDTKARETTATEEQVTDDLQAMPVMEPQAVDEKIDPSPKECTDTETRTAEREKTPPPDAVM